MLPYRSYCEAHSVAPSPVPKAFGTEVTVDAYTDCGPALYQPSRGAVTPARKGALALPRGSRDSGVKDILTPNFPAQTWARISAETQDQLMVVVAYVGGLAIAAFWLGRDIDTEVKRKSSRCNTYLALTAISIGSHSGQRTTFLYCLCASKEVLQHFPCHNSEGALRTRIYHTRQVSSSTNFLAAVFATTASPTGSTAVIIAILTERLLTAFAIIDSL